MVDSNSSSNNSSSSSNSGPPNYPDSPSFGKNGNGIIYKNYQSTFDVNSVFTLGNAWIHLGDTLNEGIQAIGNLVNSINWEGRSANGFVATWGDIVVFVLSPLVDICYSIGGAINQYGQQFAAAELAALKQASKEGITIGLTEVLTLIAGAVVGAAIGGVASYFSDWLEGLVSVASEFVGFSVRVPLALAGTAVAGGVDGLVSGLSSQALAEEIVSGSVDITPQDAVQALYYGVGFAFLDPEVILGLGKGLIPKGDSDIPKGDSDSDSDSDSGDFVPLPIGVPKPPDDPGGFSDTDSDTEGMEFPPGLVNPKSAKLLGLQDGDLDVKLPGQQDGPKIARQQDADREPLSSPPGMGHGPEPVPATSIGHTPPDDATPGAPEPDRFDLAVGPPERIGPPAGSARPNADEPSAVSSAPVLTKTSAPHAAEAEDGLLPTAVSGGREAGQPGGDVLVEQGHSDVPLTSAGALGSRGPGSVGGLRPEDAEAGAGPAAGGLVLSVRAGEPDVGVPGSGALGLDGRVPAPHAAEDGLLPTAVSGAGGGREAGQPGGDVLGEQGRSDVPLTSAEALASRGPGGLRPEDAEAGSAAGGLVPSVRVGEPDVGVSGSGALGPDAHVPAPHATNEARVPLQVGASRNEKGDDPAATGAAGKGGEPRPSGSKAEGEGVASSGSGLGGEPPGARRAPEAGPLSSHDGDGGYLDLGGGRRVALPEGTERGFTRDGELFYVKVPHGDGAGDDGGIVIHRGLGREWSGPRTESGDVQAIKTTEPITVELDGRVIKFSSKSDLIVERNSHLDGGSEPGESPRGLTWGDTDKPGRSSDLAALEGRGRLTAIRGFGEDGQVHTVVPKEGGGWREVHVDEMRYQATLAAAARETDVARFFLRWSDEELGRLTTGELKTMLHSGSNELEDAAIYELLRRGRDVDGFPVVKGKSARWVQVKAARELVAGNRINMDTGEGKTLVLEWALIKVALKVHKFGEGAQLNLTRDFLADEAQAQLSVLHDYGFKVVRISQHVQTPPVDPDKPTIYVTTLQDDAFNKLNFSVHPKVHVLVDEEDEGRYYNKGEWMQNAGPGTHAPKYVTSRLEQDKEFVLKLSYLDYERDGSGFYRLNESGRAQLTQSLGGGKPTEERVSQVEVTLYAHYGLREGTHYVVDPHEDKIVLIEEGTGKVHVDDGKGVGATRFQGGLHQSLEAKHGLPVRNDASEGDGAGSLKKLTQREYFNHSSFKSVTGASGTNMGKQAYYDAMRPGDGPSKLYKAPRYYSSRAKQVEPIVGRDREDALSQIADVVMDHSGKGGAALILMGDNRDVAGVANALRAKGLENFTQADAEWYVDKNWEYRQDPDNAKTPDELLRELIADSGKAGKVTISSMINRGADPPKIEKVMPRVLTDIDKFWDFVVQSANRVARSGEPGEVQFVTKPTDEIYTGSSNPQVPIAIYGIARARSAAHADGAAVGGSGADRVRQAEQRLLDLVPHLQAEAFNSRLTAGISSLQAANLAQLREGAAQAAPLTPGSHATPALRGLASEVGSLLGKLGGRGVEAEPVTVQNEFSQLHEAVAHWAREMGITYGQGVTSGASKLSAGERQRIADTALRVAATPRPGDTTALTAAKSAAADARTKALEIRAGATGPGGPAGHLSAGQATEELARARAERAGRASGADASRVVIGGRTFSVRAAQAVGGKAAHYGRNVGPGAGGGFFTALHESAELQGFAPTLSDKGITSAYELRRSALDAYAQESAERGDPLDAQLGGPGAESLDYWMEQGARRATELAHIARDEGYAEAIAAVLNEARFDGTRLGALLPLIAAGGLGLPVTMVVSSTAGTTVTDLGQGDGPRIFVGYDSALRSWRTLAPAEVEPLPGGQGVLLTSPRVASRTGGLLPRAGGWFTVAGAFDADSGGVRLGADGRTLSAGELAGLLPGQPGWGERIAESGQALPQVILLGVGAAGSADATASFAAGLAEALAGKVLSATASIETEPGTGEVTLAGPGSWKLHRARGTSASEAGGSLIDALREAADRARAPGSAATPESMVTQPAARHAGARFARLPAKRPGLEAGDSRAEEGAAGPEAGRGIPPAPAASAPERAAAALPWLETLHAPDGPGGYAAEEEGLPSERLAQWVARTMVNREEIQGVKANASVLVIAQAGEPSGEEDAQPFDADSILRVASETEYLRVLVKDHLKQMEAAGDDQLEGIAESLVPDGVVVRDVIDPQDCGAPPVSEVPSESAPGLTVTLRPKLELVFDLDKLIKTADITLEDMENPYEDGSGPARDTVSAIVSAIGGKIPRQLRSDDVLLSLKLVTGAVPLGMALQVASGVANDRKNPVHVDAGWGAPMKVCWEQTAGDTQTGTGVMSILG